MQKRKLRHSSDGVGRRKNKGRKRNRRSGGISGRRMENRLGGLETFESRVVMTASIFEAPVDVPVAPVEETAVDRRASTNGTSRIVNGTQTSDFESVGMIGDNSGNFCSGTLITPNHVLTAAHCAVGVGNTAGRFTVGGNTYSTTRVDVHPGYNDNTLANDIAIYTLSQSVTGVTPSPIFRGTPQVGDLLTLVGFGGGGTGDSGHTGDFGTKRVGTTPIDGVTDTLITWNFDNNSESNTAPGDSGGPAFLNVNGEMQVAGVTSGGNQANAGIGDFSFDTRVDAFASWVDSITGQTPNPDPDPDPNPDPDPDPDPEPTTDDHANNPGTDATLVVIDASGAGSDSGSLEEEGDRDVFAIEVDESGTATITTNATTDLDTVLEVFDSNGNLIADNDDFGGSLNSQVTLDVSPGTYYASVGAYADSEVGNYDLDVQLESDVIGDDDGPFEDAIQVDLDGRGRGRANGSIDSAGQTEMYAVTADSTGRLIVRTRARSGDLDTMLTIYDAEGNEVAFNDDFRGTDSRVRLNVNAGETFYVEVSSYGDSTGSYRLIVNNRAARSAGRSASVDNIMGQQVNWLANRYGYRF